MTGSRRTLFVAVLSSAATIYLDAGAVLVAVRAQRHFSAAAWIGFGCIAVAVSWTAVRAWRRIAANRRHSN
jgi:hypothetical protein